MDPISFISVDSINNEHIPASRREKGLIALGVALSAISLVGLLIAGSHIPIGTSHKVTLFIPDSKLYQSLISVPLASGIPIIIYGAKTLVDNDKKRKESIDALNWANRIPLEAKT